MTEERWHIRRMKGSDASEIGRWIRFLYPPPRALERELAQVLKRLLVREKISAWCVEEQGEEGSDGRPVAIGVTTFVSDALTSSYLAKPTPNLNLTLLEEERANKKGGGSMLTPEQVGRCNAADGLNLLILFWIHEQADFDFSKERNRQLFIQGKTILERHYRGYKLKQVLLEGLSPQTRLAMLSLGLKELRTFPAGTPMTLTGERSYRELVLTGLSREEARPDLPASPAVDLFVHRSPICHFTRREQQVLELALEQMTNEEIASALGRKVETIRARWRSIFDRMQTKGLLPEDDDNGMSTSPHVSKRRAALRYVRDHPEELRPYAWKDR